MKTSLPILSYLSDILLLSGHGGCHFPVNAAGVSRGKFSLRARIQHSFNERMTVRGPAGYAPGALFLYVAWLQ